MENIVIDIAKNYAINCHRGTNHFRDGKHYDEAHLQMVVDNVEKFCTLPDYSKSGMIAAAWCHGVIEDTRQSYNDVINAFNELHNDQDYSVMGHCVADAVYLLTEHKGKNRKQRHPPEYFQAIRTNDTAWFVKWCDELANVQYSINNKSSKLDMYKEEYIDFRQMMFNPKFINIIIETDHLIYG